MNRRFLGNLDFLTQLLFSPDDAGGGGGDHDSNLESDLDILDSDADETPGEGEDFERQTEEIEEELAGDGKKKTKTPKVSKEESEEEDDQDDDDTDELDEELENQEEEEEEETEEEKAAKDKDAPVQGRPTIKQLKDSGVLKKFPGLREIYFQHQGFTKHFSDPEQAEEASIKANFYDEVENGVRSGDPKVLLQNIKEGNPAAFKRYVNNILPTLMELDQDAYLEATTPVIERLLYHASQTADKRGIPNLAKAAKWIADFVFGSPTIPDITKGQEKHPAEIQLEKDRQQRAQQDWNAATQDVNQRVDKVLVGFVTEGLPNTLSKTEKEWVTEKTLEEAISVLNKDTVHGTKIRALWRKAGMSAYSNQTKEAITNAQVARAKAVIREIRARRVDEALKGKGGRTRTNEDGNNNRPKKRQFNTSGRGGGGGRRATVLDSRQIDYRRTSDLDILNDTGGDRVKLRGRK